MGKALAFGGWPGLILLLLGNAVGIGAWLAAVGMRRYRSAFYVTIMAFPFTFYAGRAAGIRAYDIQDFDQRVGLTTFLIVSLFLILLFGGRVRRPEKGLARWVERFLWIYALTVTIGQFVTHDAWAAVFLSIGSVWQFVCFFYLLVSLVRRDRDVFALLNSVFVFSILNIVVRVIAKGESLVVSLSSTTAGSPDSFGAEAGRVGSGSLGVGVSYAGYLAMFIALGLGMYFVSKQKIYMAYIAMMFLELLNTFTRGGIFVLGVLFVLLWFRSTRKMLLRIALPAAIAIGIAWPFIYRYVTFRGFALNVMNINSFSLRVELAKMYFRDYYQFSWWGKGILRQTMVQLTPWLTVPVHNAYLEILDTCGVIPFAAFSLLTVAALLLSVRVCLLRHPRRSRSLRLAPFALVALLQWIIFANTTATSVLAYYPYEGTAVFWIVAVLPVVFVGIWRRSGGSRHMRKRVRRAVKWRVGPRLVARPLPASA